jgi:hypothetical protein
MTGQRKLYSQLTKDDLLATYNNSRIAGLAHEIIQHDLVFALHTFGDTTREIADELDMSKSTVNRILRSGYTPGALSPNDSGAVQQLIDQAWSHVGGEPIGVPTDTADAPATKLSALILERFGSRLREAAIWHSHSEQASYVELLNGTRLRYTWNGNLTNQWDGDTEITPTSPEYEVTEPAI